MSADLATLSIKVDSSGVVSASGNLEALTARSRNTETATQSMTKTFERVTTSMKVSSGSILTASKDLEQLTGKSRAVETAIVSMTKSYEKVTTSMKASSSSISTATRDFETFTEASGKSEKAASAMSGRFGKIKSACAGFMSTVGKAYDYAQQAMELMEEGAKASRIETSFKLMSDAAGFSSEKIISSMKEATQGTISSSDMMQKATSLMLQGYNPEQIERFSKVVVTASQYAGTTAAEAYDQLADAIGKRNPEALLRLGAITTDQMDVVSKAIKNGASSSEIFELAMANLELRTAQLKGTQDKEVIALQQFHAQLSETKEQTGQFITAVLQRFYALFQYISAGSLIISSDIYKMIQGIQILISHLPGTDKGKWQESAKSWGAAAENDFNEAMKLIKQANNNVWNTAETVTRTTQREIAKKSQAVDKEFNDIKRNINTARNNNSQSTSGKASKGSLTKTTFDMEAYDRAMGQYKQITAEANAAVTDDFTKANLQIIEQWREREAKLTALLDDGRISWEQYEAAITAIDAAATAEINKNLQHQIADQASFYSQIQGYDETYRNLKLEWIDKEQKRLADLYKDEVAAAKWAADEKGKLEQELFEKKTKFISDGFGQLASAFSDISKLYDEGSSAAKRWQDASKAMEIAQRAVAVVNAVAAIANQGLGDPYTAFGRIAAMAGAMGALLATIGASVNGGGSSSAQKSTSTALASEEASTSINKSNELLKDIYDVENYKLTAIYDEVKGLNDNITGLVAGIFKSGGVTTAGMDFGASPKQTFLGYINSNMINQNAGILTTIGNFLNRPLVDLNNLTDNIFGGKTTRKITQQGFALGETSIADMLASGGIDVQNWSKIKTTKDGGWFGSDKISYKDYYSSLTDKQKEMGIDDYFNSIYTNLGQSLKTMATTFGVDLANVNSYVFKAATLNLKGKKTDEEITAAIQEFISTQSDEAATAIFGTILEKYQQAGEGMYETAVRVATDMQTISYWTDAVGVSFNGTSQELMDFDESLITAAGDLETLTDNFNSFFENFYSAAEQQTFRETQLTQIMQEIGKPLPIDRAGWRDLVNSYFGVDADKYAKLLAASGPADAYYDYIEEKEEERLAAAKEAAEEALEAYKQQQTDLINAQKDAYTEQYNLRKEAMQKELETLSSYYEKLKSARESMQLNDAESQGMMFSSAKFQLSKLLKEVRGGNLSGLANADDMLKTVTSVDPSKYSTREEYLKDYHRIYNSIAEMEKITGVKKDAQERQIELMQKTYDMQMEAFQAQLDAIENLTSVTRRTGENMWSDCGWLAKYQAGEITYAEYMTHVHANRYAEGGDASGWGIAGEAGTELINFGTSSRVYSNSESRKLFDTKALESKFDVLTNQIKTDNVKIKAELAAMRLDLDRQEALGPKPTRTSL